jgi:biotin carboxyl carrier protein
MDGHHNSVAEKQLFDLCHAKTMISGPLCPIAQPAEGAWVLLHDDWIDDAQQRRLVADATRLASQVASLVGLIRRAQPGPLVRFARHVAGQQRSIVFGLIAVGLLLLVPWPYRITCDCELLPLKRRYIPAPYDGVLKQVSVQPGDLVAEGQVLARMDGQEIDWQLAAHQADYMRASKEHDASLANRNTAAAQVARLEMERLDVQIELLRNRAHNLEIKSPMGGIVLSGDPREMEGARLTMGQNLFEVGPLEEMIVELFVPDHEITYVQPGQQVRLRFDAYPHRILTATVRRVSPRAETRDQKNVFVAEVVLANPQKLLRPGMVGRSRIATGLHPLGWNLFHRPAEQLVRLILW